MSGYVLQPFRSFPNTAALSRYRRVKLSAGVLAYAGSTDVELGTLQQTMFATTESVNANVRLRNSPGTELMVAAGAITSGNPVYASANGKIASAGTLICGTAMESSTTDGDVIEVLRLTNNDVSTSISGTTAATFEADSDSGKPRVSIGSQTGGTGDYTQKILPASTLTANRTATINVDGSANLVTDYCQSVTPHNNSGAGSTILAGSHAVDVGAVTNDANDWVVLPAMADVPVGHTIRIACNAGGNFELRTPATSNTKINDVDSDGTQEYLCTDTDVVIVTRRSTTAGWIAQSITKLGAVRTAVIPD